MSALAMTIAWQLFRQRYGNIPYHAKAFGYCLHMAYHGLKGGAFAVLDTSLGVKPSGSGIIEWR